MAVTLTQQAHDFVYKKLARGELRAGQRLSSRKIAKEIGISFIPVREAFRQLASEGLIEHRPKLGVFVAQPSRQDLSELYDFREALESHAAGMVANQPIHPNDLQEMRRHNGNLRNIISEHGMTDDLPSDAETNERWIIEDVAFHMVLLRASGNRRIVKTVSDLRVMASMFGYRRKGQTCQQRKETCDEHDRIIMALQNRQTEEARLAMAEHIRRGKLAALQAFDRQRMEEAINTSDPMENLYGHIHVLESAPAKSPTQT